MAHNEFTGLSFTCENPEECPFPTGDYILSLYGFNGFHRDIYMMWIILLCVIYRGLGFITLWRSAQKQRYVQ